MRVAILGATNLHSSRITMRKFDAESFDVQHHLIISSGNRFAWRDYDEIVVPLGVEEFFEEGPVAFADFEFPGAVFGFFFCPFDERRFVAGAHVEV